MSIRAAVRLGIDVRVNPSLTRTPYRWLRASGRGALEPLIGKRVISAWIGSRAGVAAALDRDRLLAYCRVFLAVEIAAFAFLVAGTHGLIVPLSGPASTDFVSFYAAGTIADSATPYLVYDQAAHYAAEQQVSAAGVEYRFFYYPPVFLLICAILARLPYLPAFILFEAATLLFYLAVIQKIVAERGCPVLVPIIAFPAVFWTLGLGQNSFLTGRAPC
jgi:hypothetical protein